MIANPAPRALRNFLRLPSVLGVAAILPLTQAAPQPDLFEPALKEWLGSQPGGVAAAYIDANGVTFFNAGTFSKTDARAITPDTQFEIGSISKVFTALLLADAVQAGKVKLDDAVGAPFAPNTITYRQLATHTSGLPRMPARMARPDPLNPYESEGLPELVKAFNEAAFGLKPAPYVYSNFGFAALGQALGRSWGEPYATLLTKRILQPLGLTDTVLSWRLADAKRLAPPHDEANDVKNWDMNAFTPAGGLVSTTRDLAKFIQACLGAGPDSLQAGLTMTMEPQAPGAAPGRQVGLGWEIEHHGSMTVFEKNGGTGGYRSFVAFSPEKKTGIVLIANSTKWLDSLGMTLLPGRRPPAILGSTAPAEHLKEYLGRYPLSPAFIMTVTADGEQLFVQATGQSRLTLLPLTTDRYSVKGVKAEVWFERDAAGKIAALVLHQNGADRRAAKTP